MEPFYVSINTKNAEEYHQQALELERRGYEAHTPMRRTSKEIKSYELHQDSQGRRFSRNEYKGSHDYKGCTGVFRKVDAE